MSTTIDQRVVEMRFDNKHFESNVKTSMSTLDKLKQSLNLSGASKGLESINSAVKKVDMRGLGSAVETVTAKFSALDVIGATALANITNSAVNAGKRIVSALTIDPIKTGFQEYETQINAVQTILANTSSKGTTIDQVNAALDELNKYADKTIYNFTEMTRNIGTFTAAGVDLDTSVSAIQGIANLAAVSGSTSQQASTAMYQLSQALAAGTVKLQDWNSVVNAGMGGEVFQNALKRTAKVMGTDVDALIKKYGSFRESLTRGEWLTTDILTETLNQFTMAAKEGTKQWDEYKKSLMDKGYSEAQATEILKMANTATDAATKVKTFTQLWDVLKESAQSGWSQTWKILVGDFEEAKSLLTPLADVLTKFINKLSDARNAILKSALGKSFSKIGDQVKKALGPITKSADSIKKVAKSVKDYEKVVTEIIRGNWGNGQDRYNALTKAGYDWAHAQNLVNERLGCSVRHATDYKETQEETVKSTDKLTKSEAAYIEHLANLSDKQLKAKGYTEEQIKAFRDLADAADKTGIPIRDLIENIDEIDGKWLLVNSFKNVGNSIMTILESIGKAWRNAFPIKDQANGLFNFIAGLHKFSTYLVISDTTANKLTRTLKGVFAILDMVTTIAGGGFKIAFKIISEILEHFDLHILDVTAAIGDAIVAFRDWTESAFGISKILNVVVPVVKNVVAAVKDWIHAFMELPQVQKAIEGFKNKFEEFKEIGKNILEGLKNGLKNGISEIPGILMEIGEAIISAICGVLGIHSPSTRMYEVGMYVIEGLVNGIKDGIAKVKETSTEVAGSIMGVFNKDKKSESTGGIGEFFQGLVDRIKETFTNVDWSTVFAGGISIGMLYFLKKIAGAFETLASPLEGLGDLFGSTADFIAKSTKTINKVLKSFSKVMNSFAFSIKAKALKNVATSLLILVGAIAILAFLEVDKVWNAVKVVAALAGILIALSVATSLMSKASVSINKDGANINGFMSGLLAIGLSLLMLAATVKLMGSMNVDEAKQGFKGLAGLVLAIASVFAAYGLLVQGKAAKHMGKVGGMMVKLSIALLLMVGVIKLIGGLDNREIVKGCIAITSFIMFTASMMALSNIAGTNTDKIGGMLIKMAIAMGLMVAVVKLAGKLETQEMLKGAAFMAGFAVFVAAMVAITKTGTDSQIAKVGGTMLAISGAMLIMVGVVKLISFMDWKALAKGAAGIILFGAIISGLILVVKAAGKDAPKMAGTIMAFSVAIGILAGVSIILSMMSIEGLAKGIAAVALLGLVMASMVRATKDAVDCKGNLIVMTVAIGLMAVAVAMLSMIDGGKLAGAVIAMSVLMATFGLMAKASSNINSSLGTIIVLTVAIGLLATALYLLAKLPVESTLSAAGSLALLMTTISAALFAVSKIGNTKQAVKGMLALTTMVVPLCIFAIAIDKLPDIGGKTKSIIALSGVMGAMTLLLIPLTAISKLGGIKSVATGVVALTAMVGPLAAFAFTIAALPDVSNAKNSLIVLTEVLTAMTLLLVPLTLIGALGAGGALLGVVALTAMVTPLIAFALALYNLPDVSGTQANMIALTNILTAMTLLLVPLTLIGSLAIGALLGVVALTAMVVPLAAFAYSLNNLPDISDKTANIEALTSFMDVMTDILMKVTPLAPLAVVGVAAIGSLGLVITAFGVLATGIGALMEKFPSLQEFLNSGIGVLEGITEGLGRVIGSFITGFTGEIMTILPSLGNSLSGFMSNAGGFINGLRLVGTDDSIITGAKNLAAAILALAGASFVSGITSLLTLGGGSLTTLGFELSGFMNAASGFFDQVASIDPTAMEGVKYLSEAMLNLTSSQLISSIANLLGAELDLGDFGTQLQKFGECVVAFNNSVKDANIDEKAIEAAKNAGLIMVELQKSIAPMGGVVQAFTGEKNLTSFGIQLRAYGNAIVDFSDTVSKEGAIEEGAIKAARDAGLMMTELQKSIEPMGGVIEWLSGTTGLDTFGAQLQAYGTAVSAFSKSISGENAIDEGAIQAAANAGKVMAEVQKGIPEDKWLDGKISIDDFGKKIKSFGKSIKGYSNEVSEIDTEAVSNSTKAAKTLVNIAKQAANIDTEKIGNFSKVKSLGTAIKTYSDKVTGLDTGAVSSSISAIRKLVSIINSMAGLDASGVSSFTSAISSLGKVSLDEVIKAFSGASEKLSKIGTNMMDGLIKGVKSRQNVLNSNTMSIINTMQKQLMSKANIFTTAGVMLMTKFVNGLSTKKSAVNSAILTTVSTAASRLRGYYNTFYSAGSYLVSGFANGISANSYKAAAKARAMANAASSAAKKALNEHSPSKVFYKIGDFAGIGFVNALHDNISTAYGAGNEIAESAKSGLTNAINQINNLLSGDMDSRPTIRPVVDLSDVRSGVGAINGMFNNGLSIGSTANIRAISSMMSNHQNGVNADVVSAIDKLRKDLGNIGGNTYNVNGITYDDGTNVSNAIATLIHAVKVERRV